jgi:predicted aspartyl protease
MKKMFVRICLILALAPFSAQSQQSGGTLSSFLAAQGFAGAKLERRFGNHLLVPVSVNNNRAALMIDTGAPFTLIDKESAATFGLKVENTARSVGGAFGRGWERYGVSMVKSIAMGNCVLTNVPVALSDQSSMNAESSSAPTGTHIPASMQMSHINGLLGSREMRKFGMIIDCTRQMLYVSPNGPSSATSQELASFLTSRGFTRIPLRFSSNHHFDVGCTLNEQPARLLLDTGSFLTCIDKQAAAKAGVMFAPVPMAAVGAGGRAQRLSSGVMKELAIGDFKVVNTEVTLAHLEDAILQSKTLGEAKTGILGIELLSLNFGIIDTGGLNLYLRHPDKR